MEIRLYPVWDMVEKDSLERTVVVIDVLRATSTITAAYDNGVARIIPVADIETASRLVSPVDRGAKLLAGEWKGQPVDGFDLFNSPADFSRERVEGMTVIMTTTNGTRAISVASKARRIVICCLNNIDAVAAAIMQEKKLGIICAGNSGRLASEDLLCGGMLLEKLAGRYDGHSLDDAGRLAMMVARDCGDIERFVTGSDRGRQLVATGYKGDIEYCCRTSITSSVPEVVQGEISR